MEAIVPMNTSGDYKHRIKTPARNFVTNPTLYSFPSDDLSFLAGGYFTGAGLFSLSHSYPPAGLGFHHHRQQPPLLPLPVNHQNINIYRSNSSCSNNNNIRLSNNNNVKTRRRDHSITPKKSTNQKKNLKRDERDLASSEMIGPDPKDLPKDVVISRAFSSLTNNNKSSCETVSVDKFSGSVVFTPSPPPSCLPLPTFSLRPKLGCSTQAAVASSGVDAGATDSLRRLLRL